MSIIAPSRFAKKHRNVVHTRPDRDAPPSEIALGDVRTMNERNAKAVRAALDVAVQDVAGRFNLKGSVGGVRVDAHGVVFQVALDVSAPNRPARSS